MEKEETKPHIVGHRTFVLVWASLLVLTATSITVARMELGRVSTLTALAIASVKAGLVLYFFMHLKYERRLFRLMLFVPLATLSIIIGLTFFDIWYR